MNPPDDLQDIVIAAIRAQLALPTGAAVIPEQCLIEDFGADIIDLRDIVHSISMELGIPFRFKPAEVDTIASLIHFIKQEYADADS